MRLEATWLWGSERGQKWGLMRLGVPGSAGPLGHPDVPWRGSGRGSGRPRWRPPTRPSLIQAAGGLHGRAVSHSTWSSAWRPGSKAQNPSRGGAGRSTGAAKRLALEGSVRPTRCADVTLGGREPVPEAAALGGRAQAEGRESEPRHQGQESSSGKELPAQPPTHGAIC